MKRCLVTTPKNLFPSARLNRFGRLYASSRFQVASTHSYLYVLMKLVDTTKSGFTLTQRNVTSSSTLSTKERQYFRLESPDRLFTNRT